MKRILIFGMLLSMLNFGCTEAERASLIGAYVKPSTPTTKASVAPEDLFSEPFGNSHPTDEEIQLEKEFKNNKSNNPRPDEIKVGLCPDFQANETVHTKPPTEQDLVRLCFYTPEKVELSGITLEMKSNYFGLSTIYLQKDFKPEQSVELKLSYQSGKIDYSVIDSKISLTTLGWSNVSFNKGSHSITLGSMPLVRAIVNGFKTKSCGSVIEAYINIQIKNVNFQTPYYKAYNLEPKDMIIRRDYSYAVAKC